MVATKGPTNGCQRPYPYVRSPMIDWKGSMIVPRVLHIMVPSVLIIMVPRALWWYQGCL